MKVNANYDPWYEIFNIETGEKLSETLEILEADDKEGEYIYYLMSKSLKHLDPNFYGSAPPKFLFFNYSGKHRQWMGKGYAPIKIVPMKHKKK